MPIPEHIIEKVKEENDIVDVISDVVRLKRTGKNYSGLCPFHHEKTPSFSVSQDKQIFKCFGCGETGNVISFVMKNKSMTFPEAVGYLADRANITLEFEDKKLSVIQKKKENIYKINRIMGRYYYSNLLKNKIAMEYFLRRGINENILRKFGLGYSLEGWQNSVNYLKKLGISENLMLETGFVVKSEKGRIYDRFRNRVMFPVFDHNGKVIGFGGRVLDDSKPKYLNSPETILFQKGTNLYGLNFAVKAGLPNKEIIIVEGYMDCISLHQCGITNSVASLGTALTEKQSRLLKRYVDKVIIAYDADVAGQMATLRGLDILREAGLEVAVLNIPMGKDPDEFIRANGKDAFLTLIKNSESLMDYKLRRAKEGLNFNNFKDVDIYSQRLVDIFKFLDPLERSIYIKKVSEDTKFSEQALIDLLNRNGVKNTYESNICSYCDTTCYSYRRDKTTKRNGSVISL